jgi:mannose-6-phosphate isomerase-like protein (cupin superfamily)
MNDKVNLAEKLEHFTDYWSPRTVAQLNNLDVMVVKVKDEFVWHKHDDTDDFFLVLKGSLTIQLRDRNVDLEEGEMFVVPKGVEHCPIANEETHVMIIEPSGTPNTGDEATAKPRKVI